MNFSSGRHNIKISKLFAFVYSIPESDETGAHILKFFAHKSIAEDLGKPCLMEDAKIEGFYKVLNYIQNVSFVPDMYSLLTLASYLNNNNVSLRSSRQMAHPTLDFEHPKPHEIKNLLNDFFLNKWGKSPVKSWPKKKVCLFRYYLLRHIRPFMVSNNAAERIMYIYDCKVNNTYPDLIDSLDLDFNWTDFLLNKKDQYLKKEWA